MHLLIIVLLICFVIFLYGLHVLAKEDLVFVRKNVTLEALFNLAFFTAGIGLLMARVIYVLLHPSTGFLNPLVFFLFPYFPGLSLAGGVVGGMIFVMLYKRKKYPTDRILDFFAMALLGALPFGFFGAQLLVGMQDRFVGILMPIIFLATLIFFVKVLLPLNYRGEIKDGSLGYLFLLIFSFTTILARIVRAKNVLELVTQVDVILLFCLFMVGLIMVVLREREIKISRRSP